MNYTREELVKIFQALEVSLAITRLTIDACTTPEGRLKTSKLVKDLRTLSAKVQSDIRVSTDLAMEEG